MANDIQTIQNLIYEIRGQRVMLDRDLAELYGVSTGNLNKAVKRNIRRFPPDFMFQLTKEEFEFLKQSLIFQNGISNEDLKTAKGILRTGRGGVRQLPYAFTEQGLAMLSGILNSDVAIDVNISIMRAFVAIHRMVASLPKPDVNADVAQLRKDFEELKLDIEDILANQNDINEETRAQLDAISDALTELQGQKGNTSARPEIGYEAVKKQREKSQNHPPQLTNLNNHVRQAVNHATLLHTAYCRMSRAFYCLFLIVSTFFITSCESYDDPSHLLMKDYFEESQGLSQASTDSVARFSKKVNEFTTRIPEAKNDPLYTQIQSNIKMASLKITLTIADEWEDDVVIKF